MSSHEYNPQSFDANFSRVFQVLDQQNRDFREFKDEVKKQLTAIQTQTEKTNGRVTALETNAKVSSARIAVVSSGVSGAIAVVAWLIQHNWLHAP